MSMNPVAAIGMAGFFLFLCTAMARPAEPNERACHTVEQVTAAMTWKQLNAIVLRGPAMQAWVDLREMAKDDGDEYPIPDAVWVVLDRPNGTAYAGFRNGDHLCDMIVMPISVADAILKRA